MINLWSKLVAHSALAGDTKINGIKTVSLLVALVISHELQATWSIVAVDPETRVTGLAAATCGPSIQFIAKSVPGKGVVAAQAATSFKGRDTAIALIQSGVAADQILRQLSEPDFYGWFDAPFSLLQYGIATLRGGVQAGFVSGASIPAWSGGVSGENYSVQGNTLRGESVIAKVAAAFSERTEDGCTFTIEQRLLRALEAGRDAGGDKRCPRDRPAQSAILLTDRILAGDAVQSLRLVTPKEISLVRGAYHMLVPFVPDKAAAEPIQQLRDRFVSTGGKICQ